jgi:soluble lytic murein transglycosylase-like protein
MSNEISNIKSKAQIQAFSNKLKQLKQNIESASDKKELKKAAEEFESLFVYQLLKAMRKTVIKSGLLGDGFGGDIFQSMWDEKIAEQVALHGRLGLAEMVIRSLNNPKEKDQQELLRQMSSYLEKTQSAGKTSIRRLTDKLKPFEKTIKAVAKEVKLNPRLIQAVILAESGGNPEAVSPKGAKGLMQIMEETARMLQIQNLFDPKENIKGGAIYLKSLLLEFGGNLKLALAAYNAGPGNVKKHGGIPPFKETRDYVRKVLSYFKALRSDHF